MTDEATLMPESFDDLINSIYTTTDIHQYVYLLLQRFHNLTLYVIEPYISQNEGEPIKIAVSENYTIYDYGGRIVVTPNDIYLTPFFACSEFFNALEHALKMLLDLKAEDIAILGNDWAKLFIWDRCERLNTIEKIPLKLINFSPPEKFVETREAVIHYLHEHGMQPKTLPTRHKTTTQTS